MRLGGQVYEYLGHQIGEGLVSLPEARVQTITDYPTKDQERFQSFNWDRRFVPGFVGRATPLFEALRSKSPD